MDEAIKIVEAALKSINGGSHWADGAKYVLSDVLAQLKAAQQSRAPDLANALEIQRLCANCHQYHSVTVACTPSG